MEAAMVQSKALSIDAFMTELSDDRRPALERLRRLCREELAGWSVSTARSSTSPSTPAKRP
jgi:hypothetical protein